MDSVRHPVASVLVRAALPPSMAAHRAQRSESQRHPPPPPREVEEAYTGAVSVRSPSAFGDCLQAPRPRSLRHIPPVGPRWARQCGWGEHRDEPRSQDGRAHRASCAARQARIHAGTRERRAREQEGRMEAAPDERLPRARVVVTASGRLPGTAPGRPTPRRQALVNKFATSRSYTCRRSLGGMPPEGTRPRDPARLDRGEGSSLEDSRGIEPWMARAASCPAAGSQGCGPAAPASSLVRRRR